MCVPISKISGLGLKLSDPGLKLSAHLVLQSTDLSRSELLPDPKSVANGQMPPPRCSRALSLRHLIHPNHALLPTTLLTLQPNFLKGTETLRQGRCYRALHHCCQAPRHPQQQRLSPLSHLRRRQARCYRALSRCPPCCRHRTCKDTEPLTPSVWRDCRMKLGRF